MNPEVKLLEYHNPKEEWHKKIENANLERETIIVAVIQKTLRCEMCGAIKKYVWEDLKYTREDGTCIPHCSACAVLLSRIEKLPDEAVVALLQR